jgi:hypothetical protein
VCSKIRVALACWLTDLIKIDELQFASAIRYQTSPLKLTGNVTYAASPDPHHLR